MFDIKKVKEEARAEIVKERTDAAKKKLVNQMRVVEGARTILRAEELKLADIEAQIADGTF